MGPLPDTIRVVNGDLLLHSEVLRWSETSAIVYLGLTSLVATLAPTYIVSQLSQSSSKAFGSMLLQRWQLRQIAGTSRAKPA